MNAAEVSVSVIMPTFNCAANGYLRAAIESVLAQTRKPRELIIVDDGSTDGTVDLIKSQYGCVDCVRLFPVEHVNQAHARNFALSRAIGSHIAYLDSDDVWHPTKLEKSLAPFAGDGSHSPGLVFHPMDTMDARGEIRKTKPSSTSIIAYAALLEHNPIACSSVVAPKRVLVEVGPMRENPPVSEDYDLWLRVAARYPVVRIGEALGASRVHAGNVSRKVDLMEQAEMQVVGERLNGMPTSAADAIRARHVEAFARMRFGRGDYPGFRRHYANLRSLGSVSLPLRVRYAMSFLPWLHGLTRRLT